MEKCNDSTLLDEENLLNDVIEYDSVEDNSSSQPASIGNDLIITDEFIENVPIQQSPHSDASEQIIDESSIDTTRCVLFAWFGFFYERLSFGSIC